MTVQRSRPEEDHEAAAAFGGAEHTIPRSADTATDPISRVAVDRFEWERWLRRADVPPELKYVGFVMATWASENGRDVRPGDQLLSQATGKGVRTIERNRRELERRGWIEQVTRRFRYDAAEYRLTVPADIVDQPGTRPPEGRDRPP